REEVHEVDVLSGAFMLLRKSVLDKTGLLDEAFFMYGEDIDLSYRIQLAGARNYYFPKTQIIHYKGESTKKSSVNYVFVFYNAMIIFARKHFSPSNASVFSFFIRIAIYLRASIAVLQRIWKRLSLPVLDLLLLYAGMILIKNYWSAAVKVYYPAVFTDLVVPAYLLTWLTAVYLTGGYDQPIRFRKIVRGIVSGTVIILVIYALLPEQYRFSRALLLMGAAWATTGMILLRFLLHFVFPKRFALATDTRKKLLIVGNQEEGNRVLSLLKLSGTLHNFIGFVSTENSDSSAAGPEYRQFLLGSAGKLRDMVEVFSPDEIIFCAKDLTSQEIIQYMSGISGREVEFKIAPPESLFIIGSSTIDDPGELYVIDINSIGRAANRRNKRLLDISLALLLLVLLPFLLPFQLRPGGLLPNLLAVLTGKKTLVGFSQGLSDTADLPVFPKGLLSPADGLRGIQPDAATLLRLNALYAKDYQVIKDLAIVRKGLRNLGRR
ncbi:MAG: hypothetical protein RL021_448, partial [Bacteroidota bacterium]